MSLPINARRSGLAALMAAVVCALLFAAGQAAFPSDAHASCVSPPAPRLDGNWVNTNSATRAMTRANIAFSCGDVRLCDAETGQCTQAHTGYVFRMFGKCSPTDCDWGQKPAYSMGDGWYRAIYNFGFKTSHVWIRAYSATSARVWVFNDFTAADGRTDYTTDEWFRKV